LLLPVAAFGLGAWWLAPYPLSSRAFLYLTSLDSFPVEALNVAQANKLGGKVFAFYEWGGYVDLRTDGTLQVFIDGRADTVFDDQTYRRYTRVLGLAPGWEKIVDASGADYFLWPKRHPKQIEALRDSGKWRTLYADHVAALLIRADHPRPEPLLPSPDSAWRELALGWRASVTQDLPEAEKHFQRALELMPNLRAACERLANVQAKSDRLSEAESTLDRCQRLFPDPARRQQLLSVFRSRTEPPP
jgi:tetratricopeptide (TPR) repeat protein